MNLDPKLAFLFERRSIRIYSPGEISDTAVTQLLQAAMAAPSAMTKDPWRFIVVRDSKMLAKLAGMLPGGKMLATCSMGIVVCGDLEAALDGELSYLLQDCSAATENLLLAAHALGLGGCWVGVHPREESVRGVKEVFGLATPIVPLAVVSLGIAGEAPEARTRYQSQYVHSERW